MRNNRLLLLLALGLLGWLIFQPVTGGTDSQALLLAERLHPVHPWLKPWWVPSRETESFLFALQAALGAGLLGFCLGYLRGRKR